MLNLEFLKRNQDFSIERVVFRDFWHWSDIFGQGRGVEESGFKILSIKQGYSAGF